MPYWKAPWYNLYCCLEQGVLLVWISEFFYKQLHQLKISYRCWDPVITIYLYWLIDVYENWMYYFVVTHTDRRIRWPWRGTSATYCLRISIITTRSVMWCSNIETCLRKLSRNLSLCSSLGKIHGRRSKSCVQISTWITRRLNSLQSVEIDQSVLTSTTATG